MDDIIEPHHARLLVCFRDAPMRLFAFVVSADRWPVIRSDFEMRGIDFVGVHHADGDNVLVATPVPPSIDVGHVRPSHSPAVAIAIREIVESIGFDSIELSEMWSAMAREIDDAIQAAVLREV